jgi:hypothetical protein
MTIRAASVPHVHTALGGGIPCDYTGTIALLEGARAHDICEVCACGSCRYSSLVNGELEALGRWGAPEEDPDLLRGLFQGVLGAFATA